MPGLIAWNQANADFKESGVARKLQDSGYLWSIAEGPSGHYRAAIYPFKYGKVDANLNVEALQAETDIKLELAQ